MTAPSRGPRGNVAAPLSSPNDPLRVMDVARILGVRYQKARDLMLTGRCGPTSTDADGKLTVTRAGVETFKAERERVL